MKDIIKEVSSLGLPIDEYCVVGGGALAARGLRAYDDIDLVVTADLYAKLLDSGWREGEKPEHIYFDNAEAAQSFDHIPGLDLTVQAVIKRADLIKGIPIMSAADLIKLKQTMGREKDLRDIDLVNRYLASLE